MTEGHRASEKSVELGTDLRKLHSSNGNEEMEDNDDVSSEEDNDNFEDPPDSPIQVS